MTDALLEIKDLEIVYQTDEETVHAVNRISLNVTILGYEGELRLTAITSGGSQAVFFKLNTFGEEAFLEKLEEAVKAYKCRHTRMISGL